MLLLSFVSGTLTISELRIVLSSISVAIAIIAVTTITDIKRKKGSQHGCGTQALRRSNEPPCLRL